MPFALPDLDARTFDDLVAEAKQRIPRYLPEWTDLNESDPGIALVELFAWMTEATLYELNQAPTALRLKLLQLLGFTTREAQPARTELTFTLKSTVDSMIVPKGTRVAAVGPTNPDGSPVIFETDASVVALGAVLQGVAGYDDDVLIPFFADPSKTKATPFTPFPTQVAAGETPQLYLCFQTANGNPFPDVDVDLAFFLDDAPGDAHAPLAYACTLGAPPPPPARWTWDYVQSVTQSTDSSGNIVNTPKWVPFALLADGTSALYRSGHVRFRLPVPPSQTCKALAIATDPAAADYANLQGYWVRATLTQASYESPPSIVAIATNTAPASQAQTVSNEVLGASTGLASQTFPLAHAPVLPDTLVVTVDEGVGGPAVWQRVDDFYSYGGTAQVYTVDPASGTIAFGDGTFGAIPRANPSTPSNVVATAYRYGGGALGNVAAGTITNVQSYIAYVDKVSNPIAAQGGSDEEPVETTVLRAAHEVRGTNRAVTADDFTSLALQTPGAQIARADALPLRHPDYGTLDVPGCVTVIVIPQRAIDADPSLQPAGTQPPSPNRTTLQAVCSWLDAHRLVATELHVVGPVYRELRFRVLAYCATNTDQAAVANAIVHALRSRYAPLGPDGGWTWGATAYGAVAFATVMAVPGVTRVDAGFTMSLDGIDLPTLGDAVIGPTELLWVPTNGVDLTVRYEGST